MTALAIAERWFEMQTLDKGVRLIFEPHVVPLLRCNIWHVTGRDRDLFIDTGIGIKSLKSFADSFLQKPVTAVATHAHVDHIGGHHEFDSCLVHPLEANGLSRPNGAANLVDAGFDARDISTSLFPAIDGYDISGPLVTALPSEDYDLKSFRLSPTQKFETIVDGDIVDTGDRAFEVLHLPGHSPGAIGLWEVRTGILFSGDAIYDGPLIDNLHHSDIEQYTKTMYRLLHLPVDVVHAGHDPSFGKEKLREIALTYLRKWDK